MAIYGNLDTFPLRDIALIIKSRTGLLTITTPTGGYALYCDKDQLRGLTSPDNQAESVLYNLKSLLQQTTGQFRFDESCSLPPWVNPELKLPLCETLASIEYTSPAITHTATEPSEAHLPHPDIRYVLLRSRKPSMHPDLAHFLDSAETFLAKTCSARELSTQLNLKLQLVQHYLDELRKINKILPVRAYQQPQIAGSTSSLTTTGLETSRPAEPSVVKRLLSLLKKGAS